MSITSGTRVAVSAHAGQGSVTSSIAGRCGSTPVTSRPARSLSSVSEPTGVWWPFAQRQIGSGVPQYRSRESAQSTLFSSQFPYRPSRMCSGTHTTDAFTSSKRCFTAVVRTYQAGRA